MALRDVLEQVRADIASGHADKANEQEAKDWFITPILQALGWRGPGRVRLEHPAGQERVKMDFALQGPDRKIAALIEAKAPGSSLASHVGQMMTYAFFEGVDICVLTTGVVWWLYLPREKGNPTTRRFAELDVRSDDLDHLESTLSKCLEYKALTSGEAEEHARAIRDARQNEQRLLAELPSAWQRLLNGPNNLLVELVQEEVRTGVGLRPRKEQVAAFLANLRTQAPSAPVSPPPRPPTSPTPPTGPNTKRDAEIVRMRDEERMSFAKIGARFGLSHTRVRNIYGARTESRPAPTPSPTPTPKPGAVTGFVLRGKRHAASSSKGVWLGVAGVLYRNHGAGFERACQLRGTRRPYISRTPEGMNTPRPIAGSPYFAETKFSTSGYQQQARKLIELFGYGADELEILYE